MKKNKFAQIVTFIGVCLIAYIGYYLYKDHTNTVVYFNIENNTPYINYKYSKLEKVTKHASISSNALNADVSINKRYVGKTPITIFLKPGKYLVSVNKDGFVVKSDSIKISKENVNVHFDLLEGFRYISTGIYTSNSKTETIKGFYLSDSEVTNKLYYEFCNETGNTLPYYHNRTELNNETQPVIGVNYEDAIKFSKWFSEKTGYTCRLPKEHEWEFAASNGQPNQVYPWGDFEKRNNQYLANYHPFDFQQDKLLPMDIDGYKYTAPVKSFPPGTNNLFDMAGNVFEWMLDTIENKNDYEDMNLKVTPDSLIRIVKGGSWNFNQKLITIKSRLFVNGTIRRGNNGIRLLIEKPSAPN